MDKEYFCPTDLTDIQLGFLVETRDSLMGPHVKVKPDLGFPFNRNLYLGSCTALTLAPNIYLPERDYRQLNWSYPDPRLVAVLAHETVHLERQRQTSLVWFIVKYLTDPKFKDKEERLAFRSEVDFFRRLGLEVPEDLKALRAA